MALEALEYGSLARW